MPQNDKEYSKEEVEQAKKDIQRLEKEKSGIVKLDFNKQEEFASPYLKSFFIVGGRLILRIH